MQDSSNHAILLWFGKAYNTAVMTCYVIAMLAALKFCLKTCVAMKFVDDDDDDDDDLNGSMSQGSSSDTWSEQGRERRPQDGT